MLISIHVVARLFRRIPLLDVDGEIVLIDDDRLGSSGAVVRGARHELPAGRLLALAESELAAVDELRRRRAV